MLRYGFSKELITPIRGVPLCGYFNPRPNTGVYDDLTVKALIVECGSDYAAVVSYDLCFLTLELIERFKEALKTFGIPFVDKILFCATHTHTAPFPGRFFGADPDPVYLDMLVAKTVAAVRSAFANLAEGELLAGKATCDTLSFNRRYWMKNGKVLSNPGKLNPDIVKPEGPVDYEIPIFAFKRNGIVDMLLVNIVNHTDSVGGDMVSADWPGRMEQEIQTSFGFNIPVITMLGCSGNINHFDPALDDPQTSYEEAVRIGKAYAGIITKSLDSLKPVTVNSLKVDTTSISIPYCEISDEQVAAAEGTIERIGSISADKNLTSEGLASGEGAVAKFFAEQLLAYKKTCSGKSRDFTLVSIKIGRDVAILSLPGEPFTEIGLFIKAASRFPFTAVASLCMGSCGYVPLWECFKHGGYEILPVEGGAPAHNTASRLMKEGIMLLNK